MVLAMVARSYSDASLAQTVTPCGNAEVGRAKRDAAAIASAYVPIHSLPRFSTRATEEDPKRFRLKKCGRQCAARIHWRLQ